jgi:hypothetical protein
MSGRTEVGHVCFKGPHPSWVGEVDHGACGSKAFARIYVTVEADFLNPRGEDYTSEDAAAALREIISEWDAWRDQRDWAEAGEQ